MIIEKQNPAKIILEITTLTPSGAIKTDIIESSVTVYHLESGLEIIDLISTPLIQVGSKNIYRYIWDSPILPAGNYIAEYYLKDSSLVETRLTEDISIGYLEESINLIKNIESGKWKIINNQMIFYKEDNTTEVCRFNLFDKNGTPSMTDITERRRV
jgi:hypothetical protein